MWGRESALFLRQMGEIATSHGHSHDHTYAEKLGLGTELETELELGPTRDEPLDSIEKNYMRSLQSNARHIQAKKQKIEKDKSKIETKKTELQRAVLLSRQTRDSQTPHQSCPTKGTATYTTVLMVSSIQSQLTRQEEALQKETEKLEELEQKREELKEKLKKYREK